MRMILQGAVIGALALAAGLLPAGTAVAAPTDAELALRWAPVHYQDTDDSDYDADYLSAVDFDGEWNPQNNWEHQDDSVSQLKAVVYYSVASTSTHHFILYAFYHPRDWTEFDPFGLSTHENDMEGVLMTVRKDGSTFGALEAMITVAHQDFYSYTPAASPFTGGRESIDGPVLMRTHNGASHPQTFQEAKGHGIYAYDAEGFPGGDGVVYLPSASGASEVPENGGDLSVAYKLVDIFGPGGLWERRDNSTTFASFGAFRGDNGVDNAAHAPWRWDDKDDGADLQAGELAFDPAHLVTAYFNGETPFGRSYTNQRYVR